MSAIVQSLACAGIGLVVAAADGQRVVVVLAVVFTRHADANRV